MNAKVEMKQVRDYLRHQRKLIDNDPHLADIRGKLTFRIEGWDARHHSIRIVVRNEDVPRTPYNSCGTRFVWVNSWSVSWKWELAKALNELCWRIREGKSS
jgi:hypothetical protein